MSLASKILSACAKDRGAYDSVAGSIEPAEAIGDLYLPIWNELADYYRRDPEAQSADTELVTERVAAHALGEKRQNASREMCRAVWAEEVSPANVLDYVRDQALRSAAMKIAGAAGAHKGRDEIEPLVRAYLALCEAPEVSEEAEELSWSEVLRQRLDTTNRIRISPPCLNERLGGGVFPGTNITLFARPECGKSALALTMACGFVRRGLRVTYATNEDSRKAIMLRAASNLTGLTEAELMADPLAGERLTIEKGAARLTVRDITPGSPQELERIVKQTGAQVLIVDQLRNLRTKSASSGTENLDHVAQALRTIGKKFDLITIGITQAGDSASGKIVLEMSDIDSSKTGIPAAADVLIGVGMNEQMRDASMRQLTLCKNKVTARMETWPVSVDVFRSKYSTLK